MKRILTAVFALLTFAMAAWTQDGDTIPRLVISECNVRNGNMAWVELTNMGDTALDLSNFGASLFSGNGRSHFVYEYDGEGNKVRLTIGSNTRGSWTSHPNHRAKLEGILEPGEQYLISGFHDHVRQEDPIVYPQSYQTANNNEEKINWTDFPVLMRGGGRTRYVDNPDILAFGFDSSSVHYDLLWLWGDAGISVWYFPPETPGDSFVIDVVNTVLDDESRQTRTRTQIAGVDEAINTNHLVRKFNIKRGNIDFETGRGTSAEDSEWMLLPNEGFGTWSKYPYTIGNHGDFGLDVTSDIATVDLGGGTLTVPWGTQGGDSIVNVLDLGPGMGWFYIQDTVKVPESVEDSAHLLARDGDIVELYAFGNDREMVSLTIDVEDAAPTDLARVYPLRARTFDSDGIPVGWRTPYMVTHGIPDMDSIWHVPYGTRVDTLFKYLEKAPNAQWEIDWVDDMERTDVKWGDILKVTAEDGSTVKEYFISVLPYFPNDNAYLASITWPDYPEDELFDWVRGDTVPEFSPGRTSYSILLPFGTMNVPALVAKPQDFRAKVKIDRAANLNGTPEDRTTSFTVTSEDDSVVFVYNVMFSVDLPPEDRQQFIGEPFFTQAHHRWWWNVDAIEIYNPSDVDLDLSKYVIIGSTAANPTDAYMELNGRDSTANWLQRYRRYVPGFLYPDFPTFQANGWVLEYDPLVNPIVKPHETFDMNAQGFPTHKPERYSENLASKTEADFSSQKEWSPNTWNDPTLTGRTQHVAERSFRKWIFKIKNDSILEGTKEVGIDIDDVELVDCWGFLDDDASTWIVGEHVLNTPSTMEWRIKRKPHVYKGVLELEADLSANPDSCDWVADHRALNKYGGSKAQMERMLDDYGSHQADPITIHLSKITSLVYKVTSGYEGLQSIQGAMDATTTDAFMGYLNKAHEEQMLELHSATDGSVKAGDDNVAGGDTLHVTSANGENHTVYLLVNDPLDNDAVLVPVDGASITVEVDGSTGTIGNVMYGQTITSVLDSLTIPDLAVLTVVDADDQIMPLQVMNYDTVFVPTLVSDLIRFEVKAEDGTTILYSLAPPSLSSDAYVISNIYTVDQEGSRISLVPEGTTVDVMMANVTPVKGAVPKILDKIGHQRVLGVMAYDDKLNVISEDGTVQKTYFIDFLEEEDFETNSAPLVSVAFADTTILPGSTIMMMADVTDDGNPVPPELSFEWTVEAVSGDAGSVSIDNATETSTDMSFDAPGVFTVTLHANDREMTGQGVVTVTVAFPEGIEGLSSPALDMYPNPTSGRLHIQLMNIGAAGAEVEIVDIIGKVVYLQRHFSSELVLDVSEFGSGVYIVKMRSDDHEVTQKLHISK